MSMYMKRFIKGVKFLMPLGMIEGARYVRHKIKSTHWYGNKKYPDLFPLLAKNKELKDIHAGKRCFIVGTGVSINQLDVELLKNEHSIFVSQFYFHEKYKELVHPALPKKYHFFSGLSFHPYLGTELGIAYQKQIENSVPEYVPLLMNVQDAHLIASHRIFQNHLINYFFFKKPFGQIFDGIDATKQLYNAANAPLMAAELALYMGFSELYFLGIDYCYCPKHKGTHFYSPTVSLVDNKYDAHKDYMFKSILDEFVGGLHTLESSAVLENECRVFLELWNQWRLFHDFCFKKNVFLANVSNVGLLDIIPRVSINSLFMS